MPQKRIEFIDLAKGFCIILVVLNHCMGAHWQGNIVLSYFRMPLYFLLSGLFFKSYGNFVNFLIKKTNKLLIPYIFLYITTILLFGYIVCTGSAIPYHPLTFIRNIFSEQICINVPIWFLGCLFLVNVLFYLLVMLTRGNRIGLAVLSIGLGLVGYYWSSDKAYFLDTAMTVFPFYALGYILRSRGSELLYPNKADKMLPYLFLLLAVVYVLAIPELWSDYLPRVSYLNNTYEMDTFRVYFLGVCGIFCVLVLSKWIKHLPFISYVGRYSIIILGVHVCVLWVVDRILTKLFYFVPNDNIYFLIAVFLCTLIISSAFVPLCRKFLPYFFAQKDLIPYTWDSEKKKFYVTA